MNLLDSEKKNIPRIPTSIPEAYVKYLNGVYFTQKASMGGLKSAVQFLNKAIELDPSFTEAFSELAIDYAFLAVFGASQLTKRFQRRNSLRRKQWS